MGQATVELIGGPKDGEIIVVRTDTHGEPRPCIEFLQGPVIPIMKVTNEKRDMTKHTYTKHTYGQAGYNRHGRRWRYRYVVQK